MSASSSDNTLGEGFGGSTSNSSSSGGSQNIVHQNIIKRFAWNTHLDGLFNTLLKCRFNQHSIMVMETVEAAERLEEPLAPLAQQPGQV